MPEANIDTSIMGDENRVMFTCLLMDVRDLLTPEQKQSLQEKAERTRIGSGNCNTLYHKYMDYLALTTEEWEEKWLPSKS